ncbi:hypothetical protein GH714_023019 [Hevea brasiliensis]|uniref:Uncharacterized protein n=1 Tax=Hevea brasiliensis TaxID=3981 RepID=A0A6A6M7Q1_HEVBR|nr:hypothetical protein GH714_023019 [Hevea brasiliensis]
MGCNRGSNLRLKGRAQDLATAIAIAESLLSLRKRTRLKIGTAREGELEMAHCPQCFVQGSEEAEPIIQVALQLKKCSKREVHHEVQKGLQQPRMPAQELFKHLPPKKGVGCATKLLPSAQPPARYPPMVQFSKVLQGTKATGASPLGTCLPCEVSYTTEGEVVAA